MLQGMGFGTGFWNLGMGFGTWFWDSLFGKMGERGWYVVVEGGGGVRGMRRFGESVRVGG